MVYVFLADGFEEIEALATVDILRRADIEVKTVGIGGRSIAGAHGITVLTDTEEFDGKNLDAVVLPGGMPGTRNLENSQTVHNAIDTALNNGSIIAAICAAPSILGHKGILKGKNAVCYPGFETDLEGASVQNTQVCEDGRIITGNGPGAACEFALLLGARITGKSSDDIKANMMLK